MKDPLAWMQGLGRPLSVRLLPVVRAGLGRYLWPMVAFTTGCGAAYAYLCRLPVLDDAYVSYAFARSVANGHGYALTRFSPPVYGSTTPLWVGLLAALHRLGLGIPTASLIMQSLAWGTLTLFTFVISRRWGGWHAGFASAILVAVVPRWWQATSGMETALFCAFVAATLWAWLAARRWLLAAVVGLGSLTRPEGYLLGVIFGFAAGTRWRFRAIGPGLLALCIAVPWLLYAHFALGSVVPNTLIAKLTYAAGIVPSRQAVIEHFRLFNKTWTFVLLACTTALGAVAMLRENRDMWPYVIFVALLTTACARIPTAVFLWYFIPTMWAIVLLSVGGLALVRPAAAYGLAGLVFAGNLAHLTAPRPAPWPSFAVARWIASHARPGDTIMTWCVGGYAWYAPECDILDMAGLCSPAIVAATRVGAGYAPVIAAERPEWIVLDRQRPGERHALLPRGAVELRRTPCWVAGTWTVVYRVHYARP